MKRSLLVLSAVVIGFATGACSPARPTSSLHTQSVKLGNARLIGLVTEDGCPELLHWLQTQAAAHRERWYGAPVTLQAKSQAVDAAAPEMGMARSSAATAGDTAGAAPAAAGVDYSTTNVQEEGVDEPDIVKTDGTHLVTLAGRHLRVVDVTGAHPALRASLPLDGMATELLLAGDRMLVIGSEAPQYKIMAPQPAQMPAQMESGAGVAVDGMPIAQPFTPRTKVTVVDITDAGNPKVTSTLTLDGSYVAARMTKGVARFVLRSTPPAIQRQQQVPLESSTIDDWLPQYTYTDAVTPAASASGRAVSCGGVRHTPEFSGADLVSVISVDPADPRPGNGASVVGAGELVYASHDNLYVTSTDWVPQGTQGTQVHAFDIRDAVTTRYVASGRVDGHPLNSFSLSEFNGVLRIATTIDAATTESQVVMLRRDGDQLAQIGRVGGLGKGERIYAVRFLGDRGYVVTFRQMDPLYVLDLSKPDAPLVTGELKISGYSAYLHPIGADRLIGIGQDATDKGQRLGAQVSLFDVSDPASPKRLASHPLGSFSSAAESEHHAFLWWAPKNLAVVPTDGSGGVVGRPACPPGAMCTAQPTLGYKSSAVALSVGKDTITEAGSVTHPTGVAITRSLVVRGHLVTLSESGLASTPLDKIDDGDWLAF